MFHSLCGQSHKTASINHNWLLGLYSLMGFPIVWLGCVTLSGLLWDFPCCPCVRTESVDTSYLGIRCLSLELRNGLVLCLDFRRCFVRPDRMTLCDWQDVKIQLLTWRFPGPRAEHSSAQFYISSLVMLQVWRLNRFPKHLAVRYRGRRNDSLLYWESLKQK